MSVLNKFDTYVDMTEKLGFSKCCLINRETFSVISSLNESDYSSIWFDGETKIDACDLFK